MSRYIKDMISEGEGLRLDFKYCISDSRKIARTLSAFANTDGGTLLVGVRDNGSIAGIRSDEEIYMVDTASKLFCKPEIQFAIKQHTINGKTILEIKVKKGLDRPYLAKTDSGAWRAYSRQNDQNILANRILIDVWRKEKHRKGIMIKFTEPENKLMSYLRDNHDITLSGFKNITGISSSRARGILVNMILCKLIRINLTDKEITYTLSEPATQN